VKPVFSLNIIACQLLIESVEILQLGVHRRLNVCLWSVQLKLGFGQPTGVIRIRFIRMEPIQLHLRQKRIQLRIPIAVFIQQGLQTTGIHASRLEDNSWI
jgi:hypothetical protein